MVVGMHIHTLWMYLCSEVQWLQHAPAWAIAVTGVAVAQRPWLLPAIEGQRDAGDEQGEPDSLPPMGRPASCIGRWWPGKQRQSLSSNVKMPFEKGVHSFNSGTSQFVLQQVQVINDKRDALFIHASTCASQHFLPAGALTC